MRLYYYKDRVGNFGDDLNPWLWSRLIPEIIDQDEHTLFVGIGTILNDDIPDAEQKVVFGSGVGLGGVPRLDDSWHIYCVRGPLTASALGLPEEKAITDPAALLRTVDLPAAVHHAPVSFIPHLESQLRARIRGIDLEAACEGLGIHYIDPQASVNEVLAEIQGSEVVLAEAMHGAIVADALRVPWIPIQLYDHILDFKWKDWCRSVQLQYHPIRWSGKREIEDDSQVSSILDRALKKDISYLSSNSTTDINVAKLSDALGLLKNDWDDGVFSGSNNKSRAFSFKTPEAPTHSVGLDDSGGNANGQTWWRSRYDAMREVQNIIPKNEVVILIDDNQLGEGFLPLHKWKPFLESGGSYWGLPSDDEEAIQEAERLRREGAHYVVIAWPSFWWLTHYRGLAHYIEKRFQCVLKNDRLIVFDLR